MADDFTPHGLEVDELLRRAGFAWVEPGYWSLWLDVVELALQPQVWNAGDYMLQLYDVDRRPVLPVELLVDVKPRPRADA